MPQAVSGDQKSFTHRGSAGLRWALVLLPLFMVLGTWAWPSQHTHSCTQILPVLAPTWIDYTRCEHSITTSSHPSSGHPTPLREVRSSVNIRKKSRVAEEYHVNYSKSTMLVMKRCLFSSWNFLPLNQTVTNSGLKWFPFFLRIVFSTLWFIPSLSLLWFIFDLGRLALHSIPFPIQTGCCLLVWDRNRMATARPFSWVFFSGHFSGKLEEAISGNAFPMHG